jgi:hypothetical protein
VVQHDAAFSGRLHGAGNKREILPWTEAEGKGTGQPPDGNQPADGGTGSALGSLMSWPLSG